MYTMKHGCQSVYCATYRTSMLMLLLISGIAFGSESGDNHVRGTMEKSSLVHALPDASKKGSTEARVEGEQGKNSSVAPAQESKPVTPKGNASVEKATQTAPVAPNPINGVVTPEHAVPVLAAPPTFESSAVSSSPAAAPSSSKPNVPSPGVAHASVSPSSDQNANRFSEQTSTVGLEDPSGNWLLKRIWWEKAESLYDAIRQIDTALFELQKTALLSRTQFEKTVLDPFYLEVGLDQGKLTQAVSSLKNQLQALATPGDKQLSSSEQSLFELISSQQGTIDQLQRDIQSIGQIDSALDDAIVTLTETISLAHAHAKQAWQHLKSIAKELSDKRARELYYAIENLKEGMENTRQWVQVAFMGYLEQQHKALKSQIAEINATIQKLKERGLDLAQRYKDEQGEAIKQQQALAQQEQERAIEQAIEHTRENFTFFDYCSYAWHSFVGWLYSAWESVYGIVESFMTKKQETEPALAQASDHHNAAIAQQQPITNTAEQAVGVEGSPDTRQAAVHEVQEDQDSAMPPAPADHDDYAAPQEFEVHKPEAEHEHEESVVHESDEHEKK